MSASEGVSGAAAAGGILTIGVEAIVANWRSLAARVAPARSAAVVKADAYGLGATLLVGPLYEAGCRDFFVVTLSEAGAIRPLLPRDATIYVLNGLMPGTAAAYGDGVLPVLNSLSQCRAWAEASRGSRPSVIQVDTGMSRLGLDVAEQQALADEPGLLAATGGRLVMSHLACADEPDKPASGEQLAAFRAARARLPGLAGSLSASSGIFLGPDYHFDLTRPGAALYGIETSPLATGIKPVVDLRVRVAQLREIETGTSVGYGYTFRASRTTRLATLATGYADGWWRRFSGGAAAAFHGDTRLPSVGRVSMDSFSVDISALPVGTLAEGDLLELIGPHQSADDLARAAGTIGYEVLTSLGRRYHRVYR
ncbi:alanine racemase [Pleomorphomonas sp. JP5]|uniref:alanine racemase n=1 Tax=Pleomorphomonas sp. JP5 TaxID=2942998 RepID=UPI0020442EEE|nr:alanine racemase [Pleomorphomonas sp. JP5]MCM5558217.1 alanine racemase [Pleomorphomonas sp. JP5]